MNWLAFDTSTEQASVALSINDKMYVAMNPNLRQHAQHLLPMIDDLLQRANSKLDALQGIIFGCGPGSFTGLRIACSVAQGLAYAAGLPLYPVNSLHAIAADVLAEEKKTDTAVLALLDARMHEVYWAYYPNALHCVESHVCAAEKIQLPSAAPFILAGVGLSTYTAQLAPSIQAQILQSLERFPKAETMIRMVQSGAVAAVSIEEALPTYVRHHVTQGSSHG